MSENPLDPSAETEAKIRERAYHLWEAEGRPGGREADFWERARELQGMADSTGAGALPHPATVHPRIEEASLQENLGEFPHAGSSDQGDRMETPMTRKQANATPTMGEHDFQNAAQAPASASKRKKA